MTSQSHKLEHGHTITFNQEKHVYIHNNEYVVGMSTILGKLASPMLENWKINNQINAIKLEMEKQGIALDKIDSIIINAKSNARKQNENILSIGSIVHKLVEKWLKGEKITKPDNTIVANCFMKFQKFWKIVLAEIPACGPNLAQFFLKKRNAFLKRFSWCCRHFPTFLKNWRI